MEYSSRKPILDKQRKKLFVITLLVTTAYNFTASPFISQANAQSIPDLNIDVVTSTLDTAAKAKEVERAEADSRTDAEKQEAEALKKRVNALFNEPDSDYNIVSYATARDHESKIAYIFDSLTKQGVNDLESIQEVLDAYNAPFTAEQILSSALKYDINPKMIMAMVQQDSSYGTKGKGKYSFNPGNIGNDDAGHIKNFGNWQAGLDAVADWLNKHRTKEHKPNAAPESISDKSQKLDPKPITPAQ